MTDAEVGRAPLLRLTGIEKSFPGARALDGVDLTVDAGEVHCLLGQNGAGKSTLIKVLSGAHQPDAGAIEWLGEHIVLSSPQVAKKLGIAAIYQELDVVAGLSVAENIYLGHELGTLGVPDRKAMRRGASELLGRLGHPEISPAREAGQLSSAGQQIVSIARALSHDARLIIMDEPSAVLAGDETNNLFRVIRELAAAGVAVVYISHRLDEIREIGDRITVLKDGRAVAQNLQARQATTPDLVRLMTGRTVEYVFPTSGQQAPGDELLRVDGLTRRGEFHDVSLTVRSGEIVGIAGLVGAGRSELLETIYGRRRADAGRVLLDGHPLRRGSVRHAVRSGLGLAPEERKTQALVLDQPVAHNVTLATLRRFATFGLLRRGAEHAAATKVTGDLDVRPADVRRPMRTLSGGNQQKVVVSRWLLGGSRLLLLDEPTRGVDVGARAELYALIRTLADDGMGVLLVSSEVPEVLGLSDRVLLLKDGRIVHEAPARDLAENDVLDRLMEGRVVIDGVGPVGDLQGDRG